MAELQDHQVTILSLPDHVLDKVWTNCTLQDLAKCSVLRKSWMNLPYKYLTETSEHKHRFTAEQIMRCTALRTVSYSLSNAGSEALSATAKHLVTHHLPLLEVVQIDSSEDDPCSLALHLQSVQQKQKPDLRFSLTLSNPSAIKDIEYTTPGGTAVREVLALQAFLNLASGNIASGNVASRNIASGNFSDTVGVLSIQFSKLRPDGTTTDGASVQVPDWSPWRSLQKLYISTPALERLDLTTLPRSLRVLAVTLSEGSESNIQTSQGMASFPHLTFISLTHANPDDATQDIVTLAAACPVLKWLQAPDWCAGSEGVWALTKLAHLKYCSIAESKLPKYEFYGKYGNSLFHALTVLTNNGVNLLK